MDARKIIGNSIRENPPQNGFGARQSLGFSWGDFSFLENTSDIGLDKLSFIY